MRKFGFLTAILSVLLLASSCASKKSFQMSEAGRWAAIASRDSLAELLSGTRLQCGTLSDDVERLMSSVKNYQSLLATNQNENQKLSSSLAEKMNMLTDREKTIADAVNMFYPEMHAAAMADPSFAMISNDFKRPRKAVSKKSLHSRNAYELPIPGRKDYVVKVYPDDENKVAIVPPSDSWPHFFDAVNFWLTGGGACNYFYAKKILENTIRKSASNRSVGYGCEAPSATPSHG